MDGYMAGWIDRWIGGLMDGCQHAMAECNPSWEAPIKGFPQGHQAWVSALTNSHGPKLVKTLIPSTLPSLHLAIHKPFHTCALILTGILLTTP